MRCGGCGAKVGKTVLDNVMQQMNPPTRPEVTLGLDRFVTVGVSALVQIPSPSYFGDNPQHGDKRNGVPYNICRVTLLYYMECFNRERGATKLLLANYMGSHFFVTILGIVTYLGTPGFPPV